VAKKLIKSLSGKERTRKADIGLGIILAFIAGAMNAGGFLAVGEYTSHMTGIVSSIADYLVLNKLDLALKSLILLISFISGAATSAIIINWARARKLHSEFALPLMLESWLILAFATCISSPLSTSSINVTISLLCFIMGLQNAIITKISNSEIRTTHVTGLATDIGIELGKSFYFRNDNNNNTTMNLHKLQLHSKLLFSFLIGGVVGALSFKVFGFLATIPLSLLLALLASIPIIDDFTRPNPQ
jgi:uncharacterized membrane protein YoaK (UPF0700 family)